MADEMRRAREAQADAYVVAWPVIWDSAYAKVRLQNVGLGVALHLEMSTSLQPSQSTSTWTFRDDVLAVNQTEDFMLTAKDSGSVETLHQLAEAYQDVVVNVKWSNVFGRTKSWSATYNLKKLADGWHNAHHLAVPDDVPTQLVRISRVFEEMKKELSNIAAHPAKR
jgi:hypothetical protein